MTMDESPHDINSLGAHLEDRLEGPQKERLMEHLAGCGECRETLAALARNADLLPRPASTHWARVGDWWPAAKVWLPVAATLAVATVTLTRLDWWAQPDAGRPAVASPGAGLPGDAMGRPADSGATVPAVPEPPQASSPPAEAGASTGPGPSDERVPVLRGALRRIAGKTFRLVFGEWIDVEFDPAAALPSLDVKTSEERAALLARIPALAPYAALGERVLVVHQGTVYRFGARPPG
jgi:hypothetical protein